MKRKARLSYIYHPARKGLFLTFCQQLTVKGRDEGALLTFCHQLTENKGQGSFIIHLPPSQGRAFFNILSTINSEGEGRVSVARNQSFGTALQQIWRSLGGSQELLYSKTAKDVSASLLLNCCAQIHVEILFPGL